MRENAVSERPTCGTCPYWVVGRRGPYQHNFEWKAEGPFGECRRLPPRPMISEDSDRFAVAHQDDFCGDHPAFPQYLDALRRAQDDAGTGGAP